MVTNVGLPLLIVNGKFQSLNTMTVKDLETFIPFLVSCSVNRAGAPLINGVPEWWTSTIQYKFPLKKPNGLSQMGYRRHLSSIVCRCYWYHDAQFLLPFCAEIAKSPDSVFLQNNEDNTTSVFYVKNTIHILTFNNENRDYDMPEKKDRCGRRCLLPSTPNKVAVITDVYLCENCDAEFSSHSDMQQHEKDCYGTTGEEEHDSSKEEIEVLSHIKPAIDSPTEQNGFLSYFKLGPKSSTNLVTPSKSRKNSLETPSKRWVSADMCLHKNRTVEFSSFSGKKMLEHRARRDLIMKIEKTIATNESYCYTSSRGREGKESYSDAKVTFRKPKRTQWSHQYCFNRKQRIDRYSTLKTGLDEHSRKLLKKCKRHSLLLKRLKLPTADFYHVCESPDTNEYIITPAVNSDKLVNSSNTMTENPPGPRLNMTI